MKLRFERFHSVIEEMREDGDQSVGHVGIVLRAWFSRPRRRLILWIRLQEWLDSAGKQSMARAVSARIYSKYSCMIAPTARFGRGILFAHPVGVVIGEGVVIGDECIIFQNVTIGKRSLGEGGYPRIGNRVVIFAGAQILGEIELADDVTVGALSLVTESFLVPGSKAVGIPARMKG